MFTIAYAFEGNLPELSDLLQAAMAKKLDELTRLMFDKVTENLSGKILQKQSGELLDSLRERVEAGGNPMFGEVFIEPTTPKALALEKGGERMYEILPTKASVLRWINKGGEKVFAKHVNHPPSRAFRYLGEAYDEMVEIVPGAMEAAIQQTLDGSV